MKKKYTYRTSGGGKIVVQDGGTNIVELTIDGYYFDGPTLRELSAHIEEIACKLENGTLFPPDDILIVEGKKYKLIKED